MPHARCMLSPLFGCSLCRLCFLVSLSANRIPCCFLLLLPCCAHPWSELLACSLSSLFKGVSCCRCIDPNSSERRSESVRTSIRIRQNVNPNRSGSHCGAGGVPWLSVSSRRSGSPSGESEAPRRGGRRREVSFLVVLPVAFFIGGDGLLSIGSPLHCALSSFRISLSFA